MFEQPTFALTQDAGFVHEMKVNIYHGLASFLPKY